MDDSVITGVIGSLMTARNDAKEHSITLLGELKETYQFVSVPEGTFVLGSEGISCIDHVVELITSDKLLGERFSRAFVSNKINRLLPTLLGVSDRELQEVTTEKVKLLVQELEKAPVLQWSITMPIANLTLKIDSLQIGRVRLALMDKTLQDNTFSAFKEINETTLSPEAIKQRMSKEMSELLQNKYLNRTVAIATVDAADDNMAIQRAEEEIEHALNVLRFYSRGVLKNDARFYGMFIGVQDSLFSSSYRTICIAPKERFSLPSKRAGYFYPYEIDSGTFQLIQKLYLEELSKMLGKHERDRTDFEKLIVTAIDLFGTAMNQANPKDAYLTFVTALESLLLKEKEPRGLLAERVALIVGEDHKGREWLFKRMQDIYTSRSRIVHSGFSDVTEDDIRLISTIAFQAILRLVPVSDKINDIGKLVQACSKSKFSGPPFSAEP
jgi:hypothetical protein